MEGSQGDPEALAALAQLLDELAEPTDRKRFFSDPQQFLGPKNLPDNVKGFLGDLSYDELRVLVRTCEQMKLANLSFELPGGVRVCFL